MDLSFAAWMAPDVPEEDEDTASSSTSKEQSCDSGPDELVDVQVSEDLLMVSLKLLVSLITGCSSC